MKKLLLAAITIAAMALTGCGGDDFSCSDKGRCANNTAPSASAITTCHNILAGTCGRQYQSLQNCIRSNEKCNSTAITDVADPPNPCATLISNWESCCTANPTAC